MKRSFVVAVAAFAVIVPFVAGCMESPDSPLMADVFFNRGQNGTSIAVPDVTAEVCVVGSGAAVLSGTVTVRNAGRLVTEDLEITVRVEYKDGADAFRDLPGAEASVVAENQVPAGGTAAYQYSLGFTPVEGASYRLAIRATIMNHSGRLGTPWGVEPKRPLPSDSFLACEAPTGEVLVTITDPEDGASYAEGTVITFGGSAVDPGGSDISGSLAWESDLDGPLGSGPSIAAVISVGTHAVTASVTDGNGTGIAASVTVIVEAVAVCELEEGLTKLWRGESDGAWANPANWEPAGVPAAADQVRICASAPLDPVLGATSTVGGLLVDDGASVQLGGWSLTVSGDVDAGGAGVAGPGTLAMTGSGSTIRGVVPDLRVTGVVSPAGPLAVTGNLTIIGNGARFELGGHQVTVSGDLRTESSGALRMMDPADRLIVAGDAVFSAAVLLGNLTAGELRVAGQFSSAVNLGFRATDYHRVVLNGAAPQSVSFTQAGATSSRFQHLEVANPAGVSFGANAYVGGTLALAAGAGPVTGAVTVTVAGDMADPSSAWEVASTTFTGSPSLPAMLRSNATFTGSAVLTGDLALVGDLAVIGIGAQLELGGRQITVSGDLLTQSSGVLRMVDPADRLVVAGDAIFATAVLAGHLTAGELRVAGQFSSAVNLGFRATDDHRAVLNGVAPQSITFAQSGPTSSRFQHLEIVNPAGVSFGSNVYVRGNLALAGGAGPVTGAVAVTVAGDMADQSSAWEVASTTFAGSPALPATLRTNVTFTGPAVLAGDLALVGDLAVIGSGAQLELGGRQVTVSGDFLTQSSGVLRMADSADRLVINGDAVFAAAVLAGHLTAGELRVAGQFNVPANLGFRAAGDHRVVLDGAAVQNVDFAATGAASSRFQHITVLNAAGASFTSNVYLGGNADVTGRMAVDADRTATVAGGLALRAGATLDNQGTVTYCESLNDEGATIIGNSPVPGC